MLVHICCSVDSHFFLQKLMKEFPEEKLTAYFYDPNIHPYSEYLLRLMDVRRSCEMLGVKLIEGEYDYEGWLEAVRGLENEPEKGRRCTLCFNRRFEESARKAREIGEKSFTSTLLVSPKKSLEQLRISGEKIGRRYGLSFVAPDYRKASGTQEQNSLAKRDRLYRQDYCGCLYALVRQREEQKRLSDELFSPVSAQIQPESIEYRLQLYEKRAKLEREKVEYQIVKERFLNWRLKYALLRVKGQPVASHIVPYSSMKRGYTRGRVEGESARVYRLNRDEVKFIDLTLYNEILGTKYSCVKELIFSPPLFEDELNLRRSLLPNAYDLSTLIVVDEIPSSKLELIMDSECYEDTIERLLSVNKI